MSEIRIDQPHKQLGWWLRAVVIVGTVVALLVVVLDTDLHPRTDDASVRANFIAIAPEVEGRLVQLPVRDNAFVRKGDLLFEIDPRDYEYALRQALSDQDNLEQRIIDLQRKIAAQDRAVQAASASVRVFVTGTKTFGSAVLAAKGCGATCASRCRRGERPPGICYQRSSSS